MIFKQHVPRLTGDTFVVNTWCSDNSVTLKSKTLLVLPQIILFKSCIFFVRSHKFFCDYFDWTKISQIVIQSSCKVDSYLLASQTYSTHFNSSCFCFIIQYSSTQHILQFHSSNTLSILLGIQSAYYHSTISMLSCL